MEFKENEAIYLQIAAFVSDQIVLDKWQTEQKIPSVRELAIKLEVNPNTVLRSYEFLENQQVIYNRRGLGFYISQQGKEKIQTYRKDRFIAKDLPNFFNTIYMMDLDFKDLEKLYERFKKEKL